MITIKVGVMPASLKSHKIGQVTSLQREAEGLLAGAEYEVESGAVFELVRESDCSAYDCEFVALAIKLDTQLFTMDKKLLRAFPARALALPSV